MIDFYLRNPPVAIEIVGRLARNGELAVREEFDTARAIATVAVWDLFIARHPQSPLLPAARRLRALADSPGSFR